MLLVELFIACLALRQTMFSKSLVPFIICRIPSYPSRWTPLNPGFFRFSMNLRIWRLWEHCWIWEFIFCWSWTEFTLHHSLRPLQGNKTCPSCCLFLEPQITLLDSFCLYLVYLSRIFLSWDLFLRIHLCSFVLYFVGCFCHTVGSFCHIVESFCHTVEFSFHTVGNFCRIAGSFCRIVDFFFRICLCLCQTVGLFFSIFMCCGHYNSVWMGFCFCRRLFWIGIFNFQINFSFPILWEFFFICFRILVSIICWYSLFLLSDCISLSLVFFTIFCFDFILDHRIINFMVVFFIF